MLIDLSPSEIFTLELALDQAQMKIEPDTVLYKELEALNMKLRDAMTEIGRDHK
jgi:hypothetical protein